MRDFFGQVFLLFLGLIVELGVPLFLSKDNQKRFVRFVGVVLILVSAVWLGYELGQQTPIGQQTPTRMIPVSAQELIDWYKKFDSDLQAQEVARKLYYGKYTELTGEISEISLSSFGSRIVVDMDVDGVRVSAYFNDGGEVSTLKRDTRITVACELDYIRRNYIRLEDCRLVAVTPKAMVAITPTRFPIVTQTPSSTKTPEPAAKPTDTPAMSMYEKAATAWERETATAEAWATATARAYGNATAEAILATVTAVAHETATAEAILTMSTPTNTSTTTATPTNTPTSTATPTSAPTNTPTATAEAIPPVPFEPDEGARFSPVDLIHFKWDWHRVLEKDEYFAVRLWREGIPGEMYTLTWVKTTDYILTLAHPPVPMELSEGYYYWNVAVVLQTGPDPQHNPDDWKLITESGPVELYIQK